MEASCSPTSTRVPSRTPVTPWSTLLCPIRGSSAAARRRRCGWPDGQAPMTDWSELLAGAPRHFLQRQRVAVGVGEAGVLHSPTDVEHLTDVDTAADQFGACPLDVGHHQ